MLKSNHYLNVLYLHYIYYYLLTKKIMKTYYLNEIPIISVITVIKGILVIYFAFRIL